MDHRLTQDLSSLLKYSVLSPTYNGQPEDGCLNRRLNIFQEVLDAME